MRFSRIGFVAGLRPLGVPRRLEGEPLTALAAEALRSISIGVLCWALFFLVCIQPFFVFRKTLSAVVLSVVVLSGCVSYWSLERGRVRLASWVFVTAMASVLTVFIALSGGILSPAIGFGLAVIATAAWLLGRRVAIGIACGFTALAFGLALLAQAGIPMPRPVPAPPIVTWTLLAGFVIITALPLNRFLGALRHALQEAERQVDQCLKTEEELKRSEERYRALIETSPDAITMSDLEGRILMCNRRTAAIHGYETTEALKGISAFELVVPQERERAEAGMRRTFRGETLRNLEFTLRRADGTTFPGELSVSLIRNPDGTPAAFMAVSRDVTARKRLEAHIRQAQKLESIGLLAGGVAHDFNNLITVIRCYTNMAQSALSEPDQVRESLEEVEKAAEKASMLTGQLLAFSRKQIFRPQVLNPNSVVRDVEKMLQRLIGEQIEVITQLDPEVAETTLDPSQLGQVLMNLAVNARDAMPNGGRLTIETANVTIGSACGSDPAPGSYVRVSVGDTGTGIDKETMPRIFEPFFTTKTAGLGTGLGLSVVYGIVKQNSGEITVESEPGSGTVFRLYFPRVDDRPGPEPRSASGPGVLKGTETVLVVDDEAPIRAVVSQALRNAGYSVLCAADGEEALRTCTDHSGAIHLLLTDVVMPGMGGEELARRIEVLRPEMRVLYMSGYANNELLNGRVETGEIGFLPKPFAPHDVLARVRTILDASGPAPGEGEN